MSLSPTQTDRSAFLEAYSKADAALRVRQAKLYLILTLVLVPAYVGLDYFVYPQLVGRIFIGRLLCDLAQLPCFFALFTRMGPTAHRAARANTRRLRRASPSAG